ncbi:histidine phosphatase superfamily [Phascolomyces articulosus]|uniref:Histidine phosphatase superfamily n=1 Tax=Phascolomyces articulosus TaxID=60185 RepID=A0AAD5KNH7_9FUNG|nr:histidine phosphatase superfamily [Phascolomyces articulosus]
MSLVITLVRHGNTDANNERWLQGQMDTLLNQRGLEQATLVGKRLSSEKLDRVYCSDLTRCKQTAQGIMDHHPTIPIKYCDDIRERGFGSLSGKPISFLMNESSRLEKNMDVFVKEQGGETTEMFEKRIIQAYHAILNDVEEHNYNHHQENTMIQHIVIVTHGGPLKVLTRYWIEEAHFKVDPSNFGKRGNHGNTAVTRINVPQQQKGHYGVIELLNSTTHLGDLSGGPLDPPPSV